VGGHRRPGQGHRAQLVDPRLHHPVLRPVPRLAVPPEGRARFLAGVAHRVPAHRGGLQTLPAAPRSGRRLSIPGLPARRPRVRFSGRPKWWNGIHSRLKICRRKAYRFESGLGYDNPIQLKLFNFSYLHNFNKGFYTYVKDVEI